MIETPLAFIAGFGLGWLARGTDKPIKMPRLVRWGYTSPVPGPMPETTIGQWDLYVTAFCYWGNRLNFSERKMMAEGICSSPAYRMYKAILKGAGVIVTRERSDTKWAMEWNYAKLRTALKHGRIALPYPPGDPPLLNARGWATQSTHRTAGNAGGGL